MSIRSPLVLAAGIAFLSGGIASAQEPAQPPAKDHGLGQLHLPSLAPETTPPPKVQIAPKPGQRIEEYRINGRVYMIKVIPGGGLPPYYLVDKTGDGKFVQVPNNDAERMSVPTWVIFRF